jgi:hypothetical protein
LRRAGAVLILVPVFVLAAFGFIGSLVLPSYGGPEC